MAATPAVALTRLACACICAAAIAATALTGSATAAPVPDPVPRPVVLLLPGGGFFFDSGGMPYPARVARQLGFRPRFVGYPTPNLGRAVAYAHHMARRAGRRGRP